MAAFVRFLKDIALAFRLALKELRQSVSKMVYAILAAALGMAAVTTIGIFRQSFEASIHKQAKNLAGADLRVRSRENFSNPAFQKIKNELQSQGAQVASKIRLNSMLYNPSNGLARLARINAIEGAYPFYGNIKTEPADAWQKLQEENRNQIILAENLVDILKLKSGDRVRLGRTTFRLVGTYYNEPGSPSFGMGFGLPAFIRQSNLEKTGLVQFGSRVNYDQYFKLPPGLNPEGLKEKYWNLATKNYLTIYTFTETSSGMRRFFRTVFQFFELAGIVTLFLGAIGIAATISILIKKKIRHIAILKSSGATNNQVMLVFILMALVIALLGSILGLGLGILLPGQLLALTSKSIPLKIELVYGPLELLKGLALVVSAALLFTIYPVARLRRVLPLQVLRPEAGNEGSRQRNFAFSILLAAGIAVIFFAIISASLSSARISAYFLGATIAVTCLLYLVTQLALKLTRRLAGRVKNYQLKQGLSNLYRPGNQSATVIVSTGLGVFLLLTVVLIEGSLDKVLFVTRAERPNLFLLDIGQQQLPAVKKALDGFGIKDQADKRQRFEPKISARITAINGEPIRLETMEKQALNRGWEQRIRNREYMISSRADMFESEILTAGSWWPGDVAGTQASVDDRWAEQMGLAVGDRMSMLVQGIPLEVTVTSKREINWATIEPNSLIILSPGSLEGAAFVYYSSIFVPDKIKKEVISTLSRNFVNIGIFDTEAAIENFTRSAAQVRFVIRFMSLITLLAGLLLLIGNLIAQKSARLRETLLLKVLGGERKQLRSILAIEFLSLGLVSSLVGIILAILASAPISNYFFDVSLQVNYPTLAGLFSLVCLVSLVSGLLVSREAVNSSPMLILRAEES